MRLCVNVVFQESFIKYKSTFFEISGSLVVYWWKTATSEDESLMSKWYELVFVVRYTVVVWLDSLFWQIKFN